MKRNYLKYILLLLFVFSTQIIVAQADDEYDSGGCPPSSGDCNFNEVDLGCTNCHDEEPEPDPFFEPEPEPELEPELELEPEDPCVSNPCLCLDCRDDNTSSDPSPDPDEDGCTRTCPIGFTIDEEACACRKSDNDCKKSRPATTIPKRLYTQGSNIYINGPFYSLGTEAAGGIILTGDGVDLHGSPVNVINHGNYVEVSGYIINDIPETINVNEKTLGGFNGQDCPNDDGVDSGGSNSDSNEPVPIPDDLDIDTVVNTESVEDPVDNNDQPCAQSPSKGAKLLPGTSITPNGIVTLNGPFFFLNEDSIPFSVTSGASELIVESLGNVFQHENYIEVGSIKLQSSSNQVVLSGDINIGGFEGEDCQELVSDNAERIEEEEQNRREEECFEDGECVDVTDDSNFKIDFRFKNLLTPETNINLAGFAGLGDGGLEFLEFIANTAIKVNNNRQNTIILGELDLATRTALENQQRQEFNEKVNKLKDFIFYLSSPQFQWVDGPKLLEDSVKKVVEFFVEPRSVESEYRAGKVLFELLGYVFGAGEAKLALKSEVALAKLLDRIPKGRFNTLKLAEKNGVFEITEKATGKLLVKGNDEVKEVIEHVALELPRAGTRGGVSVERLSEFRKLPGKAVGQGKDVGEKWLKGNQGNAGFFPKSIADKMRDKNYSNFDQFREDFWRNVAADPKLSKDFSSQNITRMQNGNAPRVRNTQNLGGQNTYQIHHNTPINQGGEVYNFDNLTIVTPRYHKEILSPSYHKGYGY